MRSIGILAFATILSACGGAPFDDSSVDGDTEGTGDVGQTNDELYYAASKLWPTNLIDVCWESPAAGDATARGWVKDAVTIAWETKTGVQFGGWGACAATSNGIRIRIADERPHTQGLGRTLRGKSGGMVLNFAFTYRDDKGVQPFSSCIGAGGEGCIRKIAAHEFGHAVGFAHEHNRGDTPDTCTEAPNGTNGDSTYGSWDLNSIMNYCNPTWNNDGALSATDLAGTQALYGFRPYRPTLALAEFGVAAGGWRVASHPRVLADVNGDKRADIVGFGSAGVWVSLSTGSGFAPSSFLLAEFGYDQGWRVESHPRLVGDLNGDGRADVVGFGNDGVWVSYSTGSGLTPAAFVIADLGYDSGWRVNQHPRMLGDMNGDGKKDLVGFGNDGVWVAYSTGNGFTQPVYSVADLGYNQGWRVESHPRLIADVNGDGSEDIVGFGNDGVWVSLGSPQGLAPAAYWLAEFGYNAGGWRVESHPRFVADVNADKRADIIGFATDGVYVSLATGAGFAAPTRWVGDFGYEQGWRVDRHPRFVTDVTGDGRADVIGMGNDGVMVSTSTGTTLRAPVFQIRNFGYNGGWRVASHPILLGDVTGDRRADIVGMGDLGVWLTTENAPTKAGGVVVLPGNGSVLVKQ